LLELLVTRGGKDLITVPLDGDSFRLGRAGTNDLAVPDPAVSRHQCQIRRQGDELLLFDQSGKGTAVNGKRCRETRLQVGARIDLGALSVILREHVPPEGLATTHSGRGTNVLPSSPVPEHLVLAGTLEGRPLTVGLTGAALTLGTDPANPIVIKDSFVSGFHCRIFRKETAWFVTDLDSTNGTFVDGVRVGEARLDVGSTLALGKVRLQVQAEGASASDGGLGEIQSVDPAMQPLFDRIRRAGPTQETVLITGESGSGKELVARALHRLSRRAERPMIPLNCSAVTRDLLESELFGHERGAFTGAAARRVGLFEEGDGGTVFLDEIGELSLDMQAKLLRVLENHEIRRVGSNLPVKVDVRILAATHRSLPHRIRSGDFREDLFFRINVIELKVPPLRERPADIPLLARFFLDQATRSVGPRTLSAEALKRLQAYRFPGNVRELRHLVTGAAILAREETIGPGDLAFSPTTLADQVAESKIYRKGKTLEEVEIQAICQALAAHEFNQSAAAKSLGIARSTLVQKMERYDISPKGERAGSASDPGN
jgi:DNA-binding NtrC family response regulator